MTLLLKNGSGKHIATLQEPKLARFLNKSYLRTFALIVSRLSKNQLRLCLQIESEFEKIHSISKLLKQVEDFGIMVPEEIKETSELSVYAVSTRYPGDYEPVSETEFKEALAMAEKAVKWIEEMIETLKQDKTDENNE